MLLSPGAELFCEHFKIHKAAQKWYTLLIQWDFVRNPINSVGFQKKHSKNSVFAHCGFGAEISWASLNPKGTRRKSFQLRIEGKETHSSREIAIMGPSAQFSSGFIIL